MVVNTQEEECALASLQDLIFLGLRRVFEGIVTTESPICKSMCLNLYIQAIHL